MKILATFDGSTFSEAILPQLSMIARVPTAEFTLLAVAQEPGGLLRTRAGHPDAIGEVMGAAVPIVVKSPEPAWAENKGQAIERELAEFQEYLQGIAARLPQGTRVVIEAKVANNAAEAIVDAARERRVDVIVMATHSRSGIAHVLFGSTTEHVVRSGVCPVLVVHPTPKD